MKLLLENTVYELDNPLDHYIRAELQPVPNYVWVCPRCGEAWAKTDKEGQDFFTITAPCQAHTDPLMGIRTPGSLLAADGVKLSPALIAREFELLIRHFGGESDGQA